MKLPQTSSTCTFAEPHLQRLSNAFATSTTPAADLDVLLSGNKPIGFFGKNVKRVYRLIRISEYHSWILQCLSDETTFQTRMNDWEVTRNYLDADEWIPFMFDNEVAFATAFVEYMEQPGSGLYPCKRNLDTILIKFVEEMVKRSPELYRSQQWSWALSQQLGEATFYQDPALFNAVGDKTFGEITLKEFITHVSFHKMYYLRRFGSKLYHALRTDIERERIPWPLR
jgi:hypothetical protein